jgi:hypothetical protein
MAHSTATALDIEKYIMNATAPAWAGDSSWYVTLHTADPGAGGNQGTNEVAYTGYGGRIAVVRTTSGWTALNPSSNVAAIAFGVMTSGSPVTVTHVSIGRLSSGAGQIIKYGALTTPTVIAVGGSAPTFAIGALGDLLS